MCVTVRNEQCALTTRGAAAPDWPPDLPSGKADCVLRVTQNRSHALDQQWPLASTQGFTDHDALVPVNEHAFPVGRTSGKWNAEIVVNRELLARRGDGELHVGIDNVDGFCAF
ncbi:MAG: hypothetical protein HY854_05895 [Burkholderiales bacterium]|nr:hypothetical protein [Burkholderiales bacterium]